MNNILFEILEIKFSYNGDLGVLQHKTITNKEICNRMLINGMVTKEQYDEAMIAIQGYFNEQIQKVVNNPFWYTTI